jgi:hypothetical protein
MRTDSIHYTVADIDVKTGAPDPVDLLRLGFYFPDCGISGKLHWHILQ